MQLSHTDGHAGDFERKPIYFVQHKDDVVGAGSYKHVSDDVLIMRSMFHTLQGEGPWAGMYVFFLRLAGCNYGDKSTHCQFCDTDFRMSESSPWAFTELRGAWEKENCNRVVVTGGEPTLQRNLIALIQRNPDVQFQIESNGSQFGVIDELLDLPNCIVVISPKWSKSGKVITPTKKMMEKGVFKFLVSADENEPDNQIPGWAHFLEQEFYLSPIAVYRGQYEGEVVSAWGGNIINHELTARNYAEASSQVIMLNKVFGRKARLSIQQHIFTNIP